MHSFAASRNSRRVGRDPGHRSPRSGMTWPASYEAMCRCHPPTAPDTRILSRSPLTELGLIRPVGLRDGFRFVRGRKPTLGVGMVTYAVFGFWQQHSNAQTISFEALAHAPGSPGRVFGLDENTLADYLLEIEDASSGLCRWSETAGLKQLILEDEEIIRSGEENAARRRAIMAQDYGRRLRRKAA